MLLMMTSGPGVPKGPGMNWRAKEVSIMCADKQIGAPRLLRMLVVVLLALVGAAVAFFSLPRVARHHMDRVRHSNTMMTVLRWYNGTRLKRAGSERSATAILTHVGRRTGGPMRRRWVRRPTVTVSCCRWPTVAAPTGAAM